ncbi:esterase/lipase family protein [Nonomuraea sp. NPDC050556]|uniref:esterase/lipase family protein n=1 Tax=Nonomuraea sp. NPDC050556 TaxID=3364369 RepID=UPI0037977FF0
MKRLALVVSVLVSALLSAPAAAQAEDSGPPLTTPTATLQQAVWCDPSVQGKRTVLLVHGTGGAVEGYWDWNYMRALPRAGYGVCTVTLPGRALVDPVISVEYVVHAARHAYQQSGQKISMIGHSQGGSLIVWATKFWPDVAAHTDDVISLAGAMAGVAAGNVLCAGSWCPPVAWRASFGSHFMNALQSAPLPAGPSYTSAYSLTDEVVAPARRASTLPGAVNVAVQSICPLRVADHVTMLADSVGFALTMDALTHSGPAVPSRIGNRLSLCLFPFMADSVLPGPAALETIAAALAGLAGGQPSVSAEPPLPSYAEPYGSML